jgi:hypothetical protein
VCVIKEFFVREKNPSKAPPHKKIKEELEKKNGSISGFTSVFLTVYLSLLSTKSYRHRLLYVN